MVLLEWVPMCLLFIQCLQEGRDPHITPEDRRKAMEIALKIATAS